MAKKIYPAVLSGLEGWDGELNSWLECLQNGPIPVFEPIGGLFASLPAATQNDRALAMVNDPTAGWIVVASNGASWRKIPVQAAAQADTAGGAVLATIIADHNALLAKLRTAGVLAP